MMLMISFPPPRPLRTKWTRRVPHPVLIGHAASLTPSPIHAFWVRPDLLGRIGGG